MSNVEEARVVSTIEEVEESQAAAVATPLVDDDELVAWTGNETTLPSTTVDQALVPSQSPTDGHSLVEQKKKTNKMARKPVAEQLQAQPPPPSGLTNVDVANVDDEPQLEAPPPPPSGVVTFDVQPPGPPPKAPMPSIEQRGSALQFLELTAIDATEAAVDSTEAAIEAAIDSHEAEIDTSEAKVDVGEAGATNDMPRDDVGEAASVVGAGSNATFVSTVSEGRPIWSMSPMAFLFYSRLS